MAYIYTGQLLNKQHCMVIKATELVDGVLSPGLLCSALKCYMDKLKKQ